MPTEERGFSIVEVLVAGAIVTLMTLTGLAACRAIAAVTVAGYTAGRDGTTIDTQAGLLRNDAASAFAVYEPAADMNGAPNPASGGHEVDFYAAGDRGQQLLWRYFYDAAEHTLQRFDYDAQPARNRGMRDSLTGLIAAGSAYPKLEGVTAFDVRTVAADALGDPGRNVYSGVEALFAHRPRPLTISFGESVPAAVGGNGIVAITIANAAASRVVHLAAGSMPTGFTVTGLPLWHAIVYRVDQTHREWFGLAGKSHVFINARIEVSYDKWKSHTQWCDFNLLGQPHGLDGNDPHANYTPGERFEQAEALLAQCRRTTPKIPLAGATDNPSQPGVIESPLPVPTPPACWAAPGPAGRCWPDAAPDDWAPPPPLPGATPPPAWCTSHARSPACPPAPPAPPAGPR